MTPMARNIVKGGTKKKKKTSKAHIVKIKNGLCNLGLSMSSHFH